MNDPNGLIQWQGTYHLFYQHNPFDIVWGPPVWGHATSRDLLTWSDLPPALVPTPGTADEEGCWSGCAVNDHGVPTLIYTGVRRGIQRTCLAISHDADLRTWQKLPHNPVRAEPPDGPHVANFRDPCVWREGNTWYQAIGYGNAALGGAVLLYRSPDLIQWEYLHPLYAGRLLGDDDFWECPNFFPLGDQHVLLVSVDWPQTDRDPHRRRPVVALIGEYRERHFTPRRQQLIDGGTCLYAPQTFEDERGRRILLGWLQEERPVEEQRQAGWSGMLSLPRLLTLDQDGGLSQHPIQELERRKHQDQRLQGHPVATGCVASVPGARWCARLTLPAEAPRECAIIISSTRAPDETATITVDPRQRTITLETTMVQTAWRRPHTLPYVLAGDEELAIEIIMDHSCLEVFANGRVCLAQRIYPARYERFELAISVPRPDRWPPHLDIWPLNDTAS